MYNPLPFLFLLTTPLLTPTTATPLHERAIPSLDCNDPSTGLAPLCWLSLNMTTYMHDWARAAAPSGASAHIEKKRVPATTTATTTVPSCGDGQTWSTCFLQQAGGGSGADCSSFGATSCVAPVPGRVGVSAYMFYGAYNIYG